MRCRPRVGDVALAGALGVAVVAQLRWATLDEIRPGWWLSLLLAGAVAAIASMRRCAPILVALLLLGLKVSVVALGWSGLATALAVVVGLYTAALLASARGAAVVTALAVVGLPLAEWWASAARGEVPNALAVLLVLLLGSVSGFGMRSHRAYLTSLVDRADRAEAALNEEARRAVAENQVRIARELHDSIAHHLAIVNVHAAVADRVLDEDPAAARAAIGHVRAAAGTVMQEVSAVVTALRSDDQAPTTPGAGQLAALDSDPFAVRDLVDSFRSMGMTIELQESADLRPLPEEHAVTTYRIVQEALTNAHKHSAGAHVSVQLTSDERAVRVVVANAPSGAGVHGANGGPNGMTASVSEAQGRHGHESPPESPGRTGHGVIGMRERVAALGGRLRVGPSRDGGWSVVAELPLAGRAHPPAVPIAGEVTR